MLRVKRFGPTGAFEGYVEMDLAKPAVARAIQDAIQKGEGNITQADAEKLDGQGLSLAKLLTLGFSAEEIRAATRRRLMAIDRDLSEVERLDKELDDMLGPGFEGAQGGEAALRQFPGGLHVPSGAPAGKSKIKSEAAADLVKAAESSWRRSGRP